MSDLQKEILELIPIQFALEKKVYPISLDDGYLKVAMINRNDFLLIKDLMFVTKKKITPVQQDENEILQAISKHYNIPYNPDIEGTQVREFNLVKKTTDQYSQDDLKDDISVLQNVNKIITNAINQGASDIHFEPYDNIFRVRYRKDGRLLEVETLPMKRKFAYISRLKIMAELDIAEKRRPQDGRIRMSGGNKIVDIRVSTMPTDFGEKVVLRLLDKSSFKLNLDNIGFTEEMQEIFVNALESPHGIILVTGPTGSGKTTTLYTALNYLNKPDVNIQTIEDPIEYNLEGINQAHVRADIGFTFANALRSFLRQDPDIIMVGEIRDSETAEIAIRSALTGHLVLSTLHTNDATTAITRLIEMGIEPFLVASSLRLVMAQRLIRKLCKHCKEDYKPNVGLLNRFGIKDNKAVTIFFRGRGCDRCNHTGFMGRTAVVEMLPITEKISELILDSASIIKLRKQAKEDGMLSLADHALLKVREGISTIEEVAKQTLV